MWRKTSTINKTKPNTMTKSIIIHISNIYIYIIDSMVHSKKQSTDDIHFFTSIEQPAPHMNKSRSVKKRDDNSNQYY